MREVVRPVKTPESLPRAGLVVAYYSKSLVRRTASEDLAFRCLLGR